MNMVNKFICLMQIQLSNNRCDNMEKYISNHRYLKLYGIIWCMSICYALLHHYVNQTHFARFPPMFNVYLELQLNNHIAQDLSSAANHAILTGSSFPFLEYLHLSLYHLTGLSPFTILIIPLGSILVPLSYLTLSKSFFKNNIKLCILISIYITFYLLSFKTFRAGYVSAFAIPIFILTLSCLKKQQDYKYKPEYSLIIILFVVFLVGLWHTMAFIVTIFIITLFFVAYLINQIITQMKLRPNSQRHLRSRLSLALLSFVLIVYFKINLLSPYIKSFFMDNNFGLTSFLYPLLRKLSGNPTHSFNIQLYQYNYVNTFWGNIYFNANLLIHIIAGVIIVISMLFLLKELFAQKSIEFDVKVAILFVITSFLSQIIFSYMYSKTATGFFYVTHVFPIVGLYLLEKLNKKKLISIFLIVLISLSFILTFSSHMSNESGTTPVTKYYDTKPSCFWFQDHKNINNSVYADFSVLYKYLAWDVSEGITSTDYKDINSGNYAYIVGDMNIDYSISKNYVLIDYATMSANRPINTYESRGLLIPALNLINSNLELNKIYVDNNIGIYQFK